MSATTNSNATKRSCCYLAALAELFVTRDGNYGWRIPECPWCGGEHIHGGGDIDSDPRTALGHRAEHCCTIGEFTKPEAGSPLRKAAETLSLGSGYFLADADPRATAELIESLEVHDDDAFLGVTIREAA